MIHTPPTILSRRITGIVCAVAMLAAGCDSTTAGLTFGLGSAADTCFVPEDADLMVQDVVGLVNEVRTEQGLSTLRQSVALAQIAEGYACDMIERGYFGHDDPITGAGFAERMCQTSYAGYPAGENLAAGQPDPEAVFEAWMDSPLHRRNILGADFKEIGLGLRANSHGRLYWVQNFAGERPERRVGCEQFDDPAQASVHDLTKPLDGEPEIPNTPAASAAVKDTGDPSVSGATLRSDDPPAGE